MNAYQKRLALFLIGLFLTFSFNAYACVVPIYSHLPVAQESDCTMPGEEPVTQFCDGFKTLAVQAGLDNPSTGHAHEPMTGQTTLPLPDLISSRTVVFPPDSSQLIFPNDILLLISVFRI